jgi:hypothetical protein
LSLFEIAGTVAFGFSAYTLNESRSFTVSLQDKKNLICAKSRTQLCATWSSKASRAIIGRFDVGISGERCSIKLPGFLGQIRLDRYTLNVSKSHILKFFRNRSCVFQFRTRIALCRIAFHERLTCLLCIIIVLGMRPMT